MKYILKNRIFVFILICLLFLLYFRNYRNNFALGPFIILFMIFTIDISKRRQNN